MREYASTRPLRQALRVAGGESEPADRTTAQQVGQGGRLTNPRPRRSRRSLRSGLQIALPALFVQVLPVVGNRSSRVLIFATLFKEERGTIMVPRSPRTSLHFGSHCVAISPYCKFAAHTYAPCSQDAVCTPSVEAVHQ